MIKRELRNQRKAKSEKRKVIALTAFRFSLVSSKGFTIVEMLTVTIIISILFAIGSRTYYNERERFQFNESFNQLLGMLNTARNSAITSQSAIIGGKPTVPRDGYGVYIKLNPLAGQPHFTLFASTDHDNDPLTFTTQFDGSKDVVLETYRLPLVTDFQFLSFDTGLGFKEKWNLANGAGVASANGAVVFFRPPLAEVYLGDNADPSQELDQLKLRFFNPKAPDGSPRRCPFVEINRIRGFAALDYTDCSESTYPL